MPNSPTFTHPLDDFATPLWQAPSVNGAGGGSETGNGVGVGDGVGAGHRARVELVDLVDHEAVQAVSVPLWAAISRLSVIEMAATTIGTGVQSDPGGIPSRSRSTVGANQGVRCRPTARMARLALKSWKLTCRIFSGGSAIPHSPS